jgi:membrane fusion protein (multidrug efflux system)
MSRAPAKRDPHEPRRPAADDQPWVEDQDADDCDRNRPPPRGGDAPAGNGPRPATAPKDEPAKDGRSGDAADGPPKKGKKKGKKKVVLVVGLVVLLAAAVGGVMYWLHARNFATTDDAFVEGHVVAVSPQVSARVLAVHVNDNQVVHKGDLLVELDPTDYQVALAQVKAAEVGARGKLAQAKAQVTAGTAGVREAESAVLMADVNFRNVDADLKRYESLDERARSKQQYENAVAAQKTAQAQVEQAKARQASAAAQAETATAAVATAEGDVGKAQADVRRAEVNLAYCRVTAPAEGRVTRRSVEAGAYVTPAQALLAVVPANVWVVANYKETQLEDMRVGQPVTVSVDAFGGADLTGKVDSIQAGTGSRFSLLPAENATGNFVKVVQRVPVKIVLDNPQLGDGRFLSPGMSVVAKTRVR